MTRTIALILGCAGLLPLGCSPPEDDEVATRSMTTDAVMRMSFLLHAGNGQAPTELDPIYDGATCKPVKAPDGHQLTLREFNRASGSVAISCLSTGTRVAVQMKGLVPHGVYSVWHVTFREPGFDPSFSHMVGSGAIGPADGSQSALVADGNGEGSVSAVTPAGPLSKQGTMGDCLMSPDLDWLVLAAYHNGLADPRRLATDPGHPVVQVGWLGSRL
jgi:hypothetical protein